MSESISESENSEEGVTLREALMSAYDKQQDETELEASEETEEVSTDTTELETDAEAGAEAEVEAGSENSDEETDETETTVVPPEHWSDEDKQDFVKMDEVGRTLALRMEANYHKGIQKKSEELKKFRDVLDPYKPAFAGRDETEVVRNLLAAQAFITSNPVEGLKRLAANLKVDLKQLLPSEVQDDGYTDPEIANLRAELQALRDQGSQQARESEQQRQNAYLAQIAQFRDEADDNGEPKHPHFNEVYSVMAGLLQSGRATDLEDAYGQAVWAIPEYRDSVIQAKAEEKSKAEAAKRAKEAEEAKAKAKTVKGKQSAKTPDAPDTLRSALSEAYDRSLRGEL